jgi:hypothetical protein
MMRAFPRFLAVPLRAFIVIATLPTPQALGAPVNEGRYQVETVGQFGALMTASNLGYGPRLVAAATLERDTPTRAAQRRIADVPMR